MNTSIDTFNNEKIPNVPINNLNNDDFIDVFFDDFNNNVLTEKNLSSPVLTTEEKPIENPINGGMIDTKSDENLAEKIKKINNDFDKQIASPIIDETTIIPKEEPSNNVINNFDEFISNLSKNVNGANKYITQVLTDKQKVADKEKEIVELKQKTDEQQLELFSLKRKLEEQEKDLREYMAEQNKVLENKRKQADDYFQAEKLRLESEIAQFKVEADTTRSELILMEENLKMKQKQFEKEKEQFEKRTKTENEIIEANNKKLENERKQFEKEKALALESIANSDKEIKIKQEEFEQYKIFEERKLDLESQNLAKSCARFKQIISQLNSGFSQLQTKE